MFRQGLQLPGEKLLHPVGQPLLTVLQRGGPVVVVYLHRGETVARQPGRKLLRRGEIEPGRAHRQFQLLTGAVEGLLHRRNVPGPAELADELPAGLQGLPHIFQQGVVVGDPVEHRVGEYHVKLALKGQAQRVAHLKRQLRVLDFGPFHHGAGAVHPHHPAAPGRQLGRERAGAAAQVQNGLRRVFGQKGQQPLPVFRHKIMLLVVQCGIPLHCRRSFPAAAGVFLFRLFCQTRPRAIGRFSPPARPCGAGAHPGRPVEQVDHPAHPDHGEDGAQPHAQQNIVEHSPLAHRLWHKV